MTTGIAIMDSASLRFADYATSGAFQVGLTRTQIATLMQVASGDYTPFPHMGTIGALERKGLTQMVEAAGKTDHAQVRPTAAGILVAQLCTLAGLTNSATPDLAEQVDRMTAEIATMRVKAFEMGEDWWSLRARLEAALLEIETLKAEKAGGYFPRPLVTLKDRQPDKPLDGMIFAREGIAAPKVDQCPTCKGHGFTDYAHLAIDPCPDCNPDADPCPMSISPGAPT